MVTKKVLSKFTYATFIPKLKHVAILEFLKEGMQTKKHIKYKGA